MYKCRMAPKQALQSKTASKAFGEDRLKIERVQKSALHVILGDEYRSYGYALKKLNMETLFVRRQRLCIKFTKKSQEHPKFTKWFKINQKLNNTRSVPSKLCQLFTRTERFRKSPISFMIELLNK